jgi:hypothetical protein
MEMRHKKRNKPSADIEQEPCNTMTIEEFVSAEILDLTETVLLPLGKFRVFTSF